RSVATTVNSCASRGATLCHMTCVSGLQCSSSSGWPEQPTRKWMRAPAPSMSRVVKPSNTQELGQLVDVGELVDLPEQTEHRFRFFPAEFGPRRALAEFFGELVVAHRVRGRALAEVGLALDHFSIGKLDLDDRGHLVEARGLGLRMNAEIHLLYHRLRVRTVHDLVRELLEPALALEEQ